MATEVNYVNANPFIPRYANQILKIYIPFNLCGDEPIYLRCNGLIIGEFTRHDNYHTYDKPFGIIDASKNYSLSRPSMAYILNLYLPEEETRLAEPIPSKTLLAHQFEEVKQNIIKHFYDPGKIILTYLQPKLEKKYKKSILIYQNYGLKIQLILPKQIAYIAFIPNKPCQIKFSHLNTDLSLTDSLTTSRIYNMYTHEKAYYFIACARNLDYHIPDTLIKPVDLSRYISEIILPEPTDIKIIVATLE
jgi:hypothetical protein